MKKFVVIYITYAWVEVEAEDRIEARNKFWEENPNKEIYDVREVEDSK
jgi:hypothetical protein